MLLQLLLLLLEHLLLLRRTHLMHRVSIRVRSGRHAAHQGRIDLASRTRHGNVAAGELVRHPTRRALLACVGLHARTSHRMSCDSRMAHRVPREVGAHTACGHHL